MNKDIYGESVAVLEAEPQIYDVMEELSRKYDDPDAALKIMVDSLPRINDVEGFLRAESKAQERTEKVTLGGLKKRLYRHPRDFGNANGGSGVSYPETESIDDPRIRADRQYHGEFNPDDPEWAFE